MENQFTITKDHLKLLKHMYVSWNDCEYGAPEINPKRPYGNSSVEEDICKILGFEEVDVNYEKGYKTEDLKKAASLHREMENVLQIGLCTGKFEEGVYVKKDRYCSRSWEKLKTNF